MPIEITIILIFFILAFLYGVIGNVFKICWMGYHDYEKVKETEFSTEYYIKDYIKENFPDYESDVFYVEWLGYSPNSTILYDDRISDFVCVKCGKCKLLAEKKKKEIRNSIDLWVKKMDEKERRKNIAFDLYNQNCKGK